MTSFLLCSGLLTFRKADLQQSCVLFIEDETIVVMYAIVIQAI